MLEQIMEKQILLWAMPGLGALGIIGMFATHLSYRRMIKKSGHLSNLKEKWLNLWKMRDRMLNRMNLLVWYPAFFCLLCLILAVFLNHYLQMNSGVSVAYVYVTFAVVILLLLLRQALDFTYKEELVMDSLTDYIEKTGRWAESLSQEQKKEQLVQEDAVEKIAASVMRTTADGSHFSKMLSPEEEKIMKEIIREFIQ